LENKPSTSGESAGVALASDRGEGRPLEGRKKTHTMEKTNKGEKVATSH